MTVAQYPITFDYGANTYPYGTPSMPYHRGQDRACPVGTPLVVNGVQIGLSGNTGLSTGPHAHIAKFVNGRDVHPNGGGFIFNEAVVTEVAQDGRNGKYVRITGDGASWVYLHLSEQNVQPGQRLTVTQPVPTPPPALYGQTVTLPAHVPSWAIYREGSAMQKGTGDQLGTLLPANFGGLTYDIIAWVSNYGVIIQTKSFGRGVIWVRDTDAIISNKEPVAPPVPTPPPAPYQAPSAPINISSPKYGTIVKDIPGYISGPNALNHINPVTTVKAGSDYFVFTNKYGMDNVTLISGQPGAWINPGDNVPDPPPPVIVPVEEPKRTQDDIKKDWVLPPQEPVIVLPTPPLPTPTPEPETPDYQQVYHPFSKPVWYKAITDTFVQDMQTNELIALSEGRELPIHGTFIKDLVLYGRVTKKGSEGWYGVPLNDLNLALTPQQKLEKVGNTVLNEPVFIDSARPTFDRISHTIHTTDLLIDKAFRVFDIFKPKVKKKQLK